MAYETIKLTSERTRWYDLDPQVDEFNVIDEDGNVVGTWTSGWDGRRAPLLATLLMILVLLIIWIW